jgi:sialic acid synthase SpsE
MDIEIIAELAQGFEGNRELAKLLIRAAADAGSDAAKFQLVYADELATPDYKYYPLFRGLEMLDEDWKFLAEYAKEQRTALYLDIFGIRSLDLAARIGVQGVKLHGTDIANLALLEAVANSSVPKVLLGAGGALLSEIEQAIITLKRKEVTVLLGFQGYPTPTEDNQIERVRNLVWHFSKYGNRVRFGFADHADSESSLRISLACLAIGAGASCLEKHLTLGKIMKLEDHESALNPDEFSEFVAVIRDTAAALGTTADRDDFGMSESEGGYRKMIRRHVVSARPLEAGTVLKPTDLVLKRTACETPLTDLSVAYGKTLQTTLAANRPVTPESLK